MNSGLTGPQRRLALWQGFVTFFMTVTAGGLLSGLVGSQLGGLLALCAAGLQGGTTTYLMAVRPPDTVAGQRDAAA